MKRIADVLFVCALLLVMVVPIVSAVNLQSSRTVIHPVTWADGSAPVPPTGLPGQSLCVGL